MRGVYDTWYFTCARATKEKTAPPEFDVMELRRDGKVRLTSTLDATNFDGTFALKEQNLSLTFRAPGQVAPVELKLKAALMDGDASLCVVDGASVFFFCRKDRLLNDDVAGHWAVAMAGGEDQLALEKDGSCSGANGQGYYRLWRSSFGPAITLVLRPPGEAGSVQVAAYDRRHEALILAPVDPGTSKKGPGVTYRLVQ